MSKDMEKQARKGTDRRGSLNVGEAIEPVEKALNRLTDGADKSGKRIAGNQDISLLPFSGSKQH